MPSGPANARPTTNQAPAITASHPPSIAVARLREPSSKKPPATADGAGKHLEASPLAVVHVHD